MSNVNANININIDTTAALVNLKRLESEINQFQRTVAASNATASQNQQALNRALLDGIKNTGMFDAKIVSAHDSVARFNDQLDRGKLSLGQYTRYAASQLPGMSRVFQKEFDTIQKVAESRVKKINTQYLALGKTVDGVTRAIAATPTTLGRGYATDLALATQRQQLFNKMIDDGSTKLLNWGKNTQWAGRQLMVGFSIPLAALGTVASKTFMEIDKSTVALKRVYGDLNTTTGEINSNVDALKSLGKEYTKYGIALSETIDIGARAAATGAKNEDLIAATEQTMRLATLGQIDYNQALDATISLQSAFGISSKDLGETINYLNTVENQTILTLDDMTLAVPRVATVIKGLGGDVKDLAVFMTAMREGGVSAENAANALKSGLASLINPTKAAKEHLGGVGINIQKIVQTNKGDLMGIITTFGKALNSLDQFQRQQALEKVFGKYQYARMGALFSNITKDSSQAARAMDIAKMSAQELAEVANKELSTVSESTSVKFQAAMEQLKISIAPLGEAFLKGITPVVNMVSKIADAFNNLPDGVKNAVAVITVALAGLGPVLLMSIGLLGNGLANIVKGVQFLRRNLARIRGDGAAFDYMSAAELEAVAATNSLNTSANNLVGTLNLQKRAVAALTVEYERFAAAAGIAGGAMRGVGGAPMPGGGRPRLRRNQGGTIPGSGNTDTVPAMLTPGEFVVNKQSTAENLPLLQAINGGEIPGYAFGGQVLQRLMRRAQSKPKLGLLGTTAAATGRRAPQSFKTELGKIEQEAAMAKFLEETRGPNSYFETVMGLAKERLRSRRKIGYWEKDRKRDFYKKEVAHTQKTKSEDLKIFGTNTSMFAPKLENQALQHIFGKEKLWSKLKTSNIFNDSEIDIIDKLLRGIHPTSPSDIKATKNLLNKISTTNNEEIQKQLQKQQWYKNGWDVILSAGLEARLNQNTIFGQLSHAQRTRVNPGYEGFPEVSQTDINAAAAMVKPVTKNKGGMINGLKYNPPGGQVSQSRSFYGIPPALLGRAFPRLGLTEASTVDEAFALLKPMQKSVDRKRRKIETRRRKVTGQVDSFVEQLFTGEQGNELSRALLGSLEERINLPGATSAVGSQNSQVQKRENRKLLERLGLSPGRGETVMWHSTGDPIPNDTLTSNVNFSEQNMANLKGAGFYGTERREVSSTYLVNKPGNLRQPGEEVNPTQYAYKVKVKDFLNLDRELSSQTARSLRRQYNNVTGGNENFPTFDEILTRASENATKRGRKVALVDDVREAIFQSGGNDVYQKLWVDVVKGMGKKGVRHTGGGYAGSGDTPHTVTILYDSVPIKRTLTPQQEEDLGNYIKLRNLFKGHSLGERSFVAHEALLDDLIARIDTLPVTEQTLKQKEKILKMKELLKERDALVSTDSRINVQWHSSDQARALNTASNADITAKHGFSLNSGNIVPGVGNTDTVPAMLTPGEFVVNKEATQNNLPLLHAINDGNVQQSMQFNTGGKVPGVQYFATDQAERVVQRRYNSPIPLHQNIQSISDPALRTQMEYLAAREYAASQAGAAASGTKVQVDFGHFETGGQKSGRQNWVLGQSGLPEAQQSNQGTQAYKSSERNRKIFEKILKEQIKAGKVSINTKQIMQKLQNGQMLSIEEQRAANSVNKEIIKRVESGEIAQKEVSKNLVKTLKGSVAAQEARLAFEERYKAATPQQQQAMREEGMRAIQQQGRMRTPTSVVNAPASQSNVSRSERNRINRAEVDRIARENLAKRIINPNAPQALQRGIVPPAQLGANATEAEKAVHRQQRIAYNKQLKAEKQKINEERDREYKKQQAQQEREARRMQGRENARLIAEERNRLMQEQRMTRAQATEAARNTVMNRPQTAGYTEQNARTRGFAGIPGGGKFGMLSGGIGGALMMGSMAPMMMGGQEGSKFLGMDPMAASMGMMGLGTVASIAPALAPLIKSHPVIAAVTAAVAALTIGFIALKKGLDNTIESAKKYADSLTTTQEEQSAIADVFGTRTYAQRRKEKEMSKISGLSRKELGVGKQFLETDPGKTMKEEAGFLLEKRASGFARNFGTQLSQSIISGAMTVNEAKSIAAAVTESLGRQDLTAGVIAQIDKILAPNGDDVTNTPIKIIGEIQASIETDEKDLENKAALAAQQYGDSWTDNILGLGALYSGEYDAMVEGSIAYSDAVMANTKSIISSYDDQIMAQEDIIKSLNDQIKTEKDVTKKTELETKRRFAIRQRDILNKQKQDTLQQRRSLEYKALYGAEKGRAERLHAARQTIEGLAPGLDAAQLLGGNYEEGKRVITDSTNKQGRGISGITYGGDLGKYYAQATGNLLSKAKGEEFTYRFTTDLVTGRIDPLAISILQSAELDKAETANRVLGMIVDLQIKGDIDNASKLAMIGGQLADNPEVLTIFNQKIEGMSMDQTLTYGDALVKIRDLPPNIYIRIATELSGMTLSEIQEFLKNLTDLQNLNIDVVTLMSEAGILGINKAVNATDTLTDSLKKYSKEVNAINKGPKNKKLERTFTVVNKVLNEEGVQITPEELQKELPEFAKDAGMTEEEILALPPKTMVQAFYMRFMADDLIKKAQILKDAAAKTSGTVAAALLEEANALEAAAKSLETGAAATATGSGYGGETQEPPEQPSGSGGGGGTKSFKDQLLDQIKLFVDATATMKQLNNAKKNFMKEIAKGAGLLTQVSNMPVGMSPTLVDYLSSLTPDELKKWMKENTKKTKGGGITLNKQGALVNRRVLEAGIGRTITETNFGLGFQQQQMTAANLMTGRFGGKVPGLGPIRTDLMQKIVGDPEAAVQLVKLYKDVQNNVKGSKAALREFINDQQKLLDNEKDLARLMDPIQAEIDDQTIAHNKITKEIDDQKQVLQDQIDAYDKQIEQLQELNSADQHRIDGLNRQKEMIQRQIDALERQNELDRRKIDVLRREDEIRNRVSDSLNYELNIMEQQEQKIRETYDKKIQSLEKIKQINDQISQQQRDQLNIATSLASGNIYEATSAAQQMQQNQINFAQQQTSQALQQGMENQISGLRTENGLTKQQAEAQINSIKEQSYQTSLLIQGVEDKIYQRNLDILPLKDAIYNIDLAIIPIQDAIYTREQSIYDIQINRIQPLQDSIDALDEQLDRENRLFESKIDQLEAQKLQSEMTDTQSKAVSALLDQWDGVRKTIAEINRLIKSGAEATADMRPPRPNPTELPEDYQKRLNEFKASVQARINDAAEKKKAKQEAEAAKENKFAGGYMTKKYAAGNYVLGSGGRDSIPAMLTPGEFIIRKAAVDQYGVPMLNSLNMGAFQIPTFDSPRYNVPNMSTGVNARFSQPNSIQMDAPVYNNYSVNVNVSGTNASADEIATKAIIKIKEMQNMQIRGNRAY